MNMINMFCLVNRADSDTNVPRGLLLYGAEPTSANTANTRCALQPLQRNRCRATQLRTRHRQRYLSHLIVLLSQKDVLPDLSKTAEIKQAGLDTSLPCF